MHEMVKTKITLVIACLSHWQKRRVTIYGFISKVSSTSVTAQLARKRIYTVSQKNDTDVAHYNFNEHQPISLIFGTEC